MSKHWYIIHVYSNFEKAAVSCIKERAKQKNLSHLFDNILIPTEKVIEVRKGRKIDTERRFFPGYLLIKMEMTNKLFHLIKNTPKVTGFLGTNNKPQSISEDEANKIIKQIKDGSNKPKPAITFEIGEQVQVSDGPFASFSGLVGGIFRHLESNWRHLAYLGVFWGISVLIWGIFRHLDPISGLYENLLGC